MTMHLVGPYMTTTQYNRKKKASKNKRNIEAQVKHDKWLRKMGVHPDQLAEKKKQNADVSIRCVPNYGDNRTSVPTSDRICDGGRVKESHKYSGEQVLLGIATMHKSNMVPVFSSKVAKDLARMRRG